MRAFDAHGVAFTLEADGLLAVCLQHEIDHLNGRVFVQYLSRLKQGRIRTRLLKSDREAPDAARGRHARPMPGRRVGASLPTPARCGRGAPR